MKMGLQKKDKDEIEYDFKLNLDIVLQDIISKKRC